MTTKKIIRQIAKQNGVTPQEVINDIKEAIRVGMASTEPTARAFWQQIAPEGKEPSITVGILDEYMVSFQKRNPHLFVFSAHLHLS